MPADFDEGDTFRNLDDALTSRQAGILNAIGAHLTAGSQAAFREQRFGGVNWLPRGVPNVAGIIGDLNRGGQPKKRRFQSRPALVDTGNLRRSITWTVAGNTVIVGTTVVYASVHQNGGVTEPVKLSDSSVPGLTALLQKEPGLQDSLGFLFDSPEVAIRVPARPFVGLQEGDLEEIERIVAEAVTGGA